MSYLQGHPVIPQQDSIPRNLSKIYRSVLLQWFWKTCLNWLPNIPGLSLLFARDPEASFISLWPTQHPPYFSVISHLFTHSLFPSLRIPTVPLKLCYRASSLYISATASGSSPLSFCFDLKYGFLSQRALSLLAAFPSPDFSLRHTPAPPVPSLLNHPWVHRQWTHSPSSVSPLLYYKFFLMQNHFFLFRFMPSGYTIC